MNYNLEFYKENQMIHVKINDNHFLLNQFLLLKESKKIISKMYQKILAEYYSDIEREVSDMKNKGEVVGAFIKKHFLKKDFSFDVIIRGKGRIVQFNLEDKLDD